MDFSISEDTQHLKYESIIEKKRSITGVTSWPAGLGLGGPDLLCHELDDIANLFIDSHYCSLAVN